MLKYLTYAVPENWIRYYFIYQLSFIAFWVLFLGIVDAGSLAMLVLLCDCFILQDIENYDE